MKTNVIMTRKMGEFDVMQRTSDGMFNATTLLSQWNTSSGQSKQISHYTDNKATQEFIVALDLDLMTDNKVNTKERNSVLIQTRGKGGGTFMHPLLFIDFAMWINSAFKLQVLKFVYDELIKNRHLAGDKYRLLSATASIFPDVNYAQVAKGLNWVVFNKHYKDIRNNATDAELDELHKLEEKLCFAVDMGLIKSYPQLIETMRKMWKDKWCRF